MYVSKLKNDLHANNSYESVQVPQSLESNSNSSFSKQKINKISGETATISLEIVNMKNNKHSYNCFNSAICNNNNLNNLKKKSNTSNANLSEPALAMNLEIKKRIIEFKKYHLISKKVDHIIRKIGKF